MAHIKRMHKIQDEGSEDVQEYPGMEQDSSEAPHSSEWQSRPPPPKKKGRPTKASLQKQIPRPVGQVVPAQRPTNEDFNEFQGQEQVPISIALGFFHVPKAKKFCFHTTIFVQIRSHGLNPLISMA